MNEFDATRVLLVEDDPSVRELLAWHLKRAGFDVLLAASVAEADGLVDQAEVVILDWMLKDESGVDWLARRRDEAMSSSRQPVLLLTARATELDKVTGLESGADDYLTKPFSTAELIARLRALLRRVRPPEVIRLGELHLDSSQGLASYAGERLKLTRREFELLAHLARNPGRVFSRDSLLDRVWGEDFLGTERTVDQHVSQLRALLGGEWIETVRGRGYRLAPPDP